MIAYFAGQIIKCEDIRSIGIKSGVVANKKDIVVVTKSETLRVPFSNDAIVLDMLQKLIENYNKYVELKTYNED